MSLRVRVQAPGRKRLGFRVQRAAASALALGALLATHSGCRSFLDRTPFARNLNAPKLDDSRPVLAEEVLDRIDGNARKIQSLIANLHIQADIDKSHHGVEGRMWMRRDRDFRLMVEESFVGQIADLGSNSQGFWFWTKPFGLNQPKQYFGCNYDDAGATPLDMAFQPDWIVEAIGLRSLSPEDRKSIEVEEGRGADEGTLILRQRRVNANGDVFYKETIVNQRTGLIKQHKLLGPDGQTPLAVAQIEEYEFHPLAFDPESESGSAANLADPNALADGGSIESAGSQSVALPKKFRLVWTRERIVLNIQVAKARINPEVDSNQFNEPAFLRNYRRIDLGRGPNSSANPSRSGPVGEDESAIEADGASALRDRQSAARRDGVVAASNEVRQEQRRGAGAGSGSGGFSAGAGSRPGFAKPFKKAKSLMDDLIGAPYPRGPQ